MTSFFTRSTFFGQIALLWSIFDGQPKISRVLMKQKLLEMEGIHFESTGRVAAMALYY